MRNKVGILVSSALLGFSVLLREVEVLHDEDTTPPMLLCLEQCTLLGQRHCECQHFLSGKMGIARCNVPFSCSLLGEKSEEAENILKIHFYRAKNMRSSDFCSIPICSKQPQG